MNSYVAFALFAADLGTSKANAIAVGLLVHLVQLFWVLVGALAMASDFERRGVVRAAPRGITPVAP